MKMPKQNQMYRRVSRVFSRILCGISFVGFFSCTLAAQAVITPPVITSTTLPNGVVHQPYPFQILTAAGGLSPYTWAVTAGALPPGLNLSTQGLISGAPLEAGDYFFVVTVQDFVTQTAMRALEIVISPALTITSTSTLPIGVAGTFYSFQIQASGPPLLSWSAVSGILPAGLTLTPGGLLAGTPNGSGVFQFTAQVAASSPPQTATQAFTLTINRALTITTPAILPIATLASPYSISLLGSGGIPPYTWTNLGASLPAGLTLSSDGVLKGTPTGLGSFTLSLQVADSFDPANTVARNFTLTITKQLTITTLSLPDGIQNANYSQQLQSSGGSSPFTWLVTSGTLPAGLILTTDGLLQGKPTAPGAQNITVTVTDSLGITTSSNFNLVIDPPISTLAMPSLPAVSAPREIVQVQMTLSQPYPSPLSGQLTLAFTSSAEVPTDDPMTQFSVGSRVVNFTIPANSTDAVFSTPIMLLTGTVAGTVTLTATFDNGPSGVPVASTNILESPPQITNVQAVRTSGGFNLQITGYSTSRRVTSAEFDFAVKSGSTTQRVTLQSNVDADFTAWYRNTASTTFGSAFSFVQSFAVQGDSSLIQTVIVRLTNAQGSTSSSSTPLQ